MKLNHSCAHWYICINEHRCWRKNIVCTFPIRALTSESHQRLGFFFPTTFCRGFKPTSVEVHQPRTFDRPTELPRHGRRKNITPWLFLPFLISRVTLFAVNMGNQTFQFNLDPPLDSSRIQSFVFSPENGDIRSRNILLNGKVLQLTDDDQVPDFEPGSYEHFWS